MISHEEKQNYSFSTVRLAIDERLNELRQIAGNRKEVELLQQLGEKIRAFEHIQKRWISGSGILADYYKTDLLKEVSEQESKFKTINQDELIAESIKSIKEGAEFAVIMAQRMILLLNDKENQSVIEQDQDFFKKIEQGLKGAKDAAKETFRKASEITAETILSDPLYKFANLLGGRFTFAQQSLDPIHGTDRTGLCYGYVMDWRNEVSGTGKYLSQQRSSKDTVLEQQQRLERFGSDPFLQFSCKSTREIWQNIDTLLSQMDTSTIYSLGYLSSSASHAMGLRKCANGEIEFFEPNLGLFVFPNANLFRVWCNELFSSRLKSNNDFAIILDIIGQQPPNSVPSIPPLSFAAAENKYENMTHQNNVSYHVTQLSLPNFKKRIKEVNEMNNKNIALNDIQINQFYDNSSIKKKIIIEIDDEIKRLKSSFFGDNQKKIMALEELASRIANAADSSLTLIGMIEEWLSTTPKDSTESYESIIKSQRIFGSAKPNSAVFIDKLVTHYEINSHCMAAMQTSIIHNILSIVCTIKQIDPNYSSPLFLEISNECMKNNINTQSFMNNIKECMSEPLGLFAKQKQNQNDDKKILHLYKIIKELEPDNPYSLTQSVLHLRNLYQEIRKDLDMKIAPPQEKPVPR